MTERRIDHIAMAVKLERNTPVLRDRRISLLGYDPAPSTPLIADLCGPMGRGR